MIVITIGRKDDNDIVVNDVYVGRNHCKLIKDEQGSYYIVDLGSTNGTYVNGMRINESVKLSINDIIRIGNTTIPWQSYFPGEIDREMKEHITQIRISMETETSLGNRLRTIIDLIGSFGVNKMNHINSILSLLTTVHLPKEYVLSSFKYGVEGFGYEHIPYIHRFDATTEWCPPENVNDKSCIRGHRIPNDNYATGAYKDEYLITGIWGYERIIDQVPSILPYFELTFSEVGILDAWVLYNLRDLLPKYWHANYGAKDFIYGIEKIEKLFPENYNGNSGFAEERNTVKDQVRSLDLDELIPQVKIDGDIATFTCVYWNHFSGLYKMETTFERVGNRVQILSQNEKCLVLHRSNIRF